MNKLSLNRCWRALLCLGRASFGAEIFRPEHLTNLGLALPARPMLFVKLHETDSRLDRLFSRFQLELRVAADNFVGLGERPVGYDHTPSREPDPGALGGWPEPPAP